MGGLSFSLVQWGLPYVTVRIQWKWKTKYYSHTLLTVHVPDTGLNPWHTWSRLATLCPVQYLEHGGAQHDRLVPPCAKNEHRTLCRRLSNMRLRVHLCICEHISATFLNLSRLALPPGLISSLHPPPKTPGSALGLGGARGHTASTTLPICPHSQHGSWGGSSFHRGRFREGCQVALGTVRVFLLKEAPSSVWRVWWAEAASQ